MKKLDQVFYCDTALCVARNLIGCFLVREWGEERIIGRINEVEAYGGAMDKACHAYGGKRTARTEPLYRCGGVAYVYCIYGMYNCQNVVTGKQGEPEAVLLRGIEIEKGRDQAARNRYGKKFDELTERQRNNLSNGPGKLCRALAVDGTFNFEPLQGKRLYICEQIDNHAKAVSAIQASKRIGIEHTEEAVDFLWRFTG